jgi:hypothetical protein
VNADQTMLTASVGKPRNPGRTLIEAINRSDLEGATSCFAKDACLLTRTRPRFAVAMRFARSWRS